VGVFGSSSVDFAGGVNSPGPQVPGTGETRKDVEEVVILFR